MPFGLKNSGATFQRMMDNLLANVSTMKCYVDDVVIHSATMKEHVQRLEKVMLLLRKHGLRVCFSKCFFMQPRVNLLDHVIDKCCVHIDEDKVRKVRDAQPPGGAKGLRLFLGSASYYHGFIYGFAKVASPLSARRQKR